MSSFQRLGVISELIQATEDQSWLLPTPVQDEAIPLILGGGDVMVAAETGSGKTAAFAIPILQTVYETLRGEAGSGTKTAGGGGGGGGGGRSRSSDINARVPSFTLSQEAKDTMFMLDSGQLKASSSGGWQGGRANIGVVKGKYYYEVTVIQGLSRVGWCTTAGSYLLGTDNYSYGYGGTAKAVHQNNYIDYGQRYNAGDVIGCFLDCGEKKIAFSVNGAYLGVSHSGVNLTSALYPAACTKNGTLMFNFGKSQFRFPPALKSGYTGIQSARLAHTSIYYRQMQMEKASRKMQGNTGQPIALILAPTRDLAQQIYDDTNTLKSHLEQPPVNTCLAIGGGMGRLMAQVIKAQIVIGTMGSVMSLLRSGKISLNQCKFFVMDEADRLLDKKQGHRDEILAVYSRLPNGVQVMLFSATLHSDAITEMSAKLCHNPQWVDLKGKDFVPDTVHHCILVVNPKKDYNWQNQQLTSDYRTDGVHDRDYIQFEARRSTNLDVLSKSEAIKLLKPLLLKRVIDAFQMDQCLVFCRTRLDCDNMTAYLTKLGGGRQYNKQSMGGKENPYSCCALHSGIPQYKRKSNLQDFKAGFIRFLICTDVAARGIDIKNLPFVINVTMPAEDEDYIHRVGRVGRVGRPGIALSLVSAVQEKVWYHKCSSRGVGCTDTRFVKNGGCCIWYDEGDIFAKVEKRLGGHPIPILDEHKHLHANKIHAFIKTVERKDPYVVESENKFVALRPRIEELTALEVVAQNQHLQIPNEFFNMMTRMNQFKKNNNNNNNNNGGGGGGRGRGRRRRRKRGREKRRAK